MSDDRQLAREVLATEIAGIGSLSGLIESSGFVEALDRLARCRGRIVVSGVGKSGLIARRISASLRSTGISSVFLHATEAAHGDLGMVAADDVALLLSKSGESEELHRLVPILRRLAIPVLAAVCRGGSTLGEQADQTLVLGPIEEAGPLKIIPTTSTSVFQVLGDLIVTCLAARRGTQEEELAFFHPGGLIGSQASLRVEELMHSGSALPEVDGSSSLRDAIVEMIDKKLGMTVVVDSSGKLAGVLTDGDIRRIVHRHGGVDALMTAEVMSKKPRTVSRDTLVSAAVAEMERDPSRLITALVVVREDGRPEGVLQLHDCLRANAR